MHEMIGFGHQQLQRHLNDFGCGLNNWFQWQREVVPGSHHSEMRKRLKSRTK